MAEERIACPKCGNEDIDMEEVERHTISAPWETPKTEKPKITKFQAIPAAPPKALPFYPSKSSPSSSNVKSEVKQQPEPKKDILGDMISTAGFFQGVEEQAKKQSPSTSQQSNPQPQQQNQQNSKTGDDKKPKFIKSCPNCGYNNVPVYMEKCPKCHYNFILKKTPKTCPKCGAEVGEGQDKCKCGQPLQGGSDKLKSYFADKGITGKTFSKEGIKNAVTSAGAGTLIKGLDKVGEKYKSFKSGVSENLKTTVYFPTSVASVTRLLIPSIQGIFPWVMIPSSIEGFLLGKFFWVLLAGLFGVFLPVGVVLGKQGVSLAALNKLCVLSIAGSVAMYGTTNVLLPAVKRFMPEEYAMMMCFIKYRGNMQICIAQNQTVQYKKVGTYETLKSEIGAVTPSQTIPPPNPVPDTWSPRFPYDLPFTLSNKNEVGSDYDITVQNIAVSASPFEDGKDSINANDIINIPNYPIKPGGSTVVTARFSRVFYNNTFSVPDLLSGLLKPIPAPNCKQYTYFNISITTEQIGGGSAKFGLIDNNEGMDNQNFMYFFDPDVKTETGPMDIYVYTLPFVVPVNSMREAAKRAGSKAHFGIYIKIQNKGEGIAFIENLTLVKTSGTQDTPVTILENSCSITNGSATPIDCPSGKKGSCMNIIYNSPIEAKKTVTFRCDGSTGNETKPFIGKATDFISINANYRYLQSSKEQIACIKDPGTVETYCDTFDSNQTECSVSSVCRWCNGCSGSKTAQHTNCTYYTDCGYSCVNGICGAACGSNNDCPSTSPYCTADCRCYFPIY